MSVGRFFARARASQTFFFIFETQFRLQIGWLVSSSSALSFSKLQKTQNWLTVRWCVLTLSLGWASTRKAKINQSKKKFFFLLRYKARAMAKASELHHHHHKLFFFPFFVVVAVLLVAMAAVVVFCFFLLTLCQQTCFCFFRSCRKFKKKNKTKKRTKSATITNEMTTTTMMMMMAITTLHSVRNTTTVLPLAGCKCVQKQNKTIACLLLLSWWRWKQQQKPRPPVQYLYLTLPLSLSTNRCGVLRRQTRAVAYSFDRCAPCREMCRCFSTVHPFNLSCLKKEIFFLFFSSF